MPVIAVRAETLLLPNSSRAQWTAVVCPEILGQSAPPGVRGLTPSVGPRKRYSAIALAQGASLSLRLSWFAAAPMAVKARLIGRLFLRPRHAAHWLAWQFRSAARTR
jgi:hypothetical protein